MTTQETKFDAVETTNLILESIKKAIRSVGLTPSTNDISLLAEAYRRKMFFHRDRPLETAWVGLGYGTRYGKSKFFRTVDGKPFKPRISEWWALSQTGVGIMQSVIETVPMPQSGSKEEQALNSCLFRF